MPLADYASTQWKVNLVEGISLCQEGDDVSFLIALGESNNVRVSCGENLTYEGKYNKELDTITGDGFVIRMVRCIKFTLQTEGLIAGSWTAEDQGPWPGDG